MNYMEGRSEDVKNLHNIYNDRISKIIEELVEIPEVSRLNNVSQSSGRGMTNSSIFNYRYTMLDHAVGVALMLDRFVGNDKMMVAGLLHEIASPTFNCAMNLMNKNDIMENAIEYSNYDMIVGSDGLFELFLKNEVSINEVCDTSRYSILTDDVPRLSVDRLENLLHGSYYTKLCQENEIKEIFNDIIVAPNEDNKPELVFETPELGMKLCRISLEMGKKYRAYESKMTMQIIADLIHLMIKRGEIRNEDLYKYGDRAILEIGLNSSDNRITTGWNMLMNVDKVYTKFTPIEGEYCKKIAMDNQYVDPLIRVKGGYARASRYSIKIKEEIEAYINSDTDLYAYVQGFEFLI